MPALAAKRQLAGPAALIRRRILTILGQNVMLDRDLAERRSRDRPPAAGQAEQGALPFRLHVPAHQEGGKYFGSQNVMPTRRSLNVSLPYAFTQEGVAMLSSVLASARAVQVNISIMRAFVALKRLAESHEDLLRHIRALEEKYAQHDGYIQEIFETLRSMLEPPTKPTRRIGF